MSTALPRLVATRARVIISDRNRWIQGQLAMSDDADIFCFAKREHAEQFCWRAVAKAWPGDKVKLATVLRTSAAQLLLRIEA